MLTPNFIPLLRAARANSPSTLRLGPTFAAFQGWNLESQRSKLSECAPIDTKYRAPARWWRSISASGSNRSAFQRWITSL